MATAEGVHIAYDDIGAGEPAVVLLHGLFENRTYYTAQTKHLASRHRVLSIDLRGHGESDVPDDGYSIDVIADDVISLCRQAGITHAVFCGHSFPVALRIAVRRPELVAGLVLLDGVVLLPDEVRERQAVFAQVLETEEGRDAAVGYFASRAATAVERVSADIAAAPAVYAGPLMRDIASSDGVEDLVTARCPILYVHGTAPIDLERLRALRPDAVIETIPNSGHYLMLTAPAEVNAALDRFIATLAGSGPVGRDMRSPCHG